MPARSKITNRSLAKHLIALRVRLSTAKLSWTEEFVDNAQGLEALEALLDKAAQKPGKDVVVAASEEGKMVQVECVRCLRALMNTDVRPPLSLSLSTTFSPMLTLSSCSQIGFSRVVARPSLVTSVVFSIYSPSLKLRSLVADVLAAMCLLSHDGRRLVLSAFSDARLDHGEKYRFEWLVDRIKVVDLPDDRTIDGSSVLSGADEEDDADEASFFEWRTAAMSLVNALANSPHDLEERMMMRDEFARRGLNEAMQGLRYVDPPDALLRQLNVYVEERQEDQEELHERTAGRSRDECVLSPLSRHALRRLY